MNRSLLIGLVVINLIGFVQMAIDKQRAVKNRRRLPESQLLAPVLFFGIIGVVAGMLIFHHKTVKMSFQIKLAIAFLIFLAGIYLLSQSPVDFFSLND